MPSVAFLGLGAIGRPMAARLAHAPGVTLTVWNRSADKARTFGREHGARVAVTPAEAAAAAEVVITCFPVSADVESLLEGTDGLLAGMKQATTLVDCTSGDPTTSRRIAARLAERGIGFLDAPVSGGTSGAEQGTLTVMVGGEPALLDRVRPALEPFARKIVHCGAVGAGDALKAVNNALLAVHLWSTAEGLAALTKAGVSPAVALDVINASSGRSNASMNLFPDRVLTRAFPRTFRLALLDKDVGIAAGVAREQKVPTPLLQLTADLFRVAHNALGDEVDHVEAVKVVEQWAGREIA
ncbi:MAG: NAD(P)-dependent oxidoreductase [Gemmatimonadaceae bacterium]|nr:NAD(P)-dependent oxidoreductase [Gemmatimonadaceae bacterium]NUP72116.1 NAD(P)-dependent oxidoreductase [Gemmatimonadaceae bacterium]NUS46437.1 NAD(P)-dependent oxidoreductase [Gemmatimonadaceae bacterium]